MKTVLVAEDDPAIATLISGEIDERLAAKTQVIPNGALVLESIETQQPDLVVLDLSLPGLSGLDVFDLIRNDRASAGVPILFLTADPERAANVSSTTGEHRVMAKPFDIDAFIAEVASLLGEKERAAA